MEASQEQAHQCSPGRRGMYIAENGGSALAESELEGIHRHIFLGRLRRFLPRLLRV